MWSGKVYLDDERMDDPALRPKRGDILYVRMSTPRRVLTGELDPARLLFVDEHLVVIDKPTELLSYAYAEQAGEPSAECRRVVRYNISEKGAPKTRCFLSIASTKTAAG